jgi:hypothetical protein
MTSRSRIALWSALTVLALGAATPARAAVVFTTDFESGLPPEFSAPGSVIEGVQGYGGLGPVGRQFGGNFLRYTSVTIFPTRLVVRNLPPHDHLSLKHLLALIDSWDSTEIMQISVDGALLFSHRFSLALADTTTYSPAPPGAILSMGHDLGFSNGSYYFRDRAYDLGVEPAFLDIPHTADSVEVVWNLSALSGPAAAQWQGGSDESWAIDAVRIEVSTQNTGVAEELAAGRLAVGAFPNPARGQSVRLRFSLPAAAPARVELLDLAGRRVASSDVGSMGAGQHSIRLTSGRPLAPGLYFARLSQGSASRMTRVVVTN